MALRTSYPVSAAVGVGPPGTSLADYGLLGLMGPSAPYAPMGSGPSVVFRPPIHGVLPSSSTPATSAAATPAAGSSGATAPISAGGFVTGIPGGATLLGGAGIPTPAVPGYKYVYPWYRWKDIDAESDAHYELKGYKEDRDAFDYFPYFPGKGVKEKAYDSGGSELKDMLVGVSLIRS